MPRIVIVLLLTFFYTLSFSQSSTNATAPQEEFKPNVSPVLIVHRIQSSIEIDGDLDDSGWVHAAKATHFTETWPGDQIKPPVETEALITYDDNYLYIAFKCYDDPQAVRASLRDRDEFFSDDYVGIILDTYGDAAWAYEIFVNPLGIQGDLRWTPDNEDESFDIIFKSGGKITEEGWQAELAIPFSSLRFPNKPVQTWKATFWRNRPRESRQRSTWATIDRDNPCFPCQFGTITNIKDVKAGSALELLPSIVGFQSGALNDLDDPNSGFKNHDPDGEASLGIRYAFTPSVGAELTFNPDFSQVESDAEQIDVNTTFALFYPERRPFFQEGSDLYNTWFDAVYTRSINNPLAATKLTGRLNRTSIGFISALDENTPIILPFEENSEVLSTDKRSVSNILRVKRTFGKDSYVGGMITDRRLEDDGSGSIFSADGILRLHQNYHIELQALVSQTREPQDTSLTSDIDSVLFDNNKHSAKFDGESFSGNALYASLERNSKFWDFDLDYWQASPTFRADNGFVTQNNYRKTSIWTGFGFFPNTKTFDEIYPSVNFSKIWNYDGIHKDIWIRPELYLGFKGQTEVSIAYLASAERFHNILFSGIRRWELYTESNFNEFIRGGFYTSYGTSIARGEDPPVLGKNGLYLEVWGTFKPTTRFVISPSLLYSYLEHPDTDEILFSGYILRSRINYQFTRELFLRLIVQYNNFEDDISIEPLLTYKLNPFSIFYIGSTVGYQEFGDDFARTSRQFFLKFQYLFRI
jgi:hypothetical protein